MSYEYHECRQEATHYFNGFFHNFFGIRSKDSKRKHNLIIVITSFCVTVDDKF